MNIDLLFTQAGEAGLVGDGALPQPVAAISFDFAVSEFILKLTDGDEVRLNIPVDLTFAQKLLLRTSIHIGLIEHGEITAVQQPALTILNHPYGGRQASGTRAPSIMAFETFLKRCVTGQPVHRDDIKDEKTVSGVLQGISPSVLKFAQNLQYERDFEKSLAHSAAPVVAAPTFGLGGSATTSQNPKKPPVKNPMNFFKDKPPQTVPVWNNPDSDDQPPQKRVPGPPPDDIDFDAIMKPLTDLIGLGPVKKEIRDIAYLAQSRSLRAGLGIAQSPISLHMVFSGPPGTGKTTVARELGKILQQLGYLDTGHVIETDRAGLVADYIGQTAGKTAQVVRSAFGGILFIDEAYTLSPGDVGGQDYGAEAIATILKMMEDHRDEFIVIAAGYTNEMSKFLDSNPGLKSRFALRIEFPHYSPGEMTAIFEKMCADNGYTVTQDAVQKLAAHLGGLRTSSQLNDFGNARGIRNIFERTMIHQANRIVTSGVKDREGVLAITADDILKSDRKLQAIPDDELQGLLRPLSSLVGMDGVKKDISDLVHLLHARIIREKHGLPTMPVVLHSIFSGPPGAGKPTVARLLGKILKRLGYLESGHVVEVDKSKLVGKYIGWTTDIVKNIVNEAENGILFIDEAYALSESRPGDDYGSEALTTILKLMEDKRENLVVICAGYEKEMKDFIASNPGLQSRFPHLFKFKTYTPDQLVQIFELLCVEQKYEPTAEALAKLLSYLKTLPEPDLNAKGNARLMRNIFEKTILTQSRRITGEGQSSKDMATLTAEDLQLPEKSEEKRIGFV